MSNDGALATAWRLGLIASVVVAAVMGVTQFTAPAIAANERSALIAQLAQLTGMEPTAMDVPARLTTGFVLCSTGQAVAVERESAPGYGGVIELIIARDAQMVRGVRVVSHTETPGIGDVIDRDRTPWIEQFAGLAIATPDAWRIDAVTGATITTRAVVAAVARHASTAATMAPPRCDP